MYFDGFGKVSVIFVQKYFLPLLQKRAKKHFLAISQKYDF